MWKDWIRPFVRPLPQWAVVAVSSPQQEITATMQWSGKSQDITADHTVASLKPLMIATSLDAGESPVIEYCDNATGRILGVLRLARRASVAADQASITLYQVEAGEHRCLRQPRRAWNTLLQNRLMQKSGSAPHSAMDAATVQQLMIAYLCPRPVVLVSVDAPGHHNIFPMDLIGPLTQSGLFSLALRSTNVSAQVMRDVRRVALSSMPATMKDIVYKLSEHHKRPLQDWNALSFPVRSSRVFGIPVVAEALRIRELTIVHSQEVGLHTFFLARITSDEALTVGAQLHHTAGYHQAYRRQHNIPFAEV
jgi:flavin reductase (DIM6/NTAB) family NADH-FMN oxidoreductase RutF